MEQDSKSVLLKELGRAPRGFWESGRSYDLLRCLFREESLRDLVPLLKASDVWTQRVALFLATELGHRASEVLDEVLPHVTSPDRHVAYDALEVLLVCATGDRVAEFWRVGAALSGSDPVLRRHAARLLSRATDEQVRVVVKLLREGWSSGQSGALEVLQDPASADVDGILTLLVDESAQVRLVTAAAALRGFPRDGVVLNALVHSQDEDVRELGERHQRTSEEGAT